MNDLDVHLAPGRAPSRTGPDLVRLLRLSAQGDVDAFMSFYDATIRAVYGYARLRYDEPAAVDQAVCVIYERAWRCAARHATSGLSPTAWLLCHGGQE